MTIAPHARGAQRRHRTAHDARRRGVLPRALVALAVTAALLPASTLPAAAAPAATPAAARTTGTTPVYRYVALGDSYSSGTGAGAVRGPGAYFGGACWRTTNSYPHLIANAIAAQLGPRGVRTEIDHRACHGAVTAQIVAQAAAVTPSTSLVTVTAGGNDAGFASIVVACLTPAIVSDACERALTDDQIDRMARVVEAGTARVFTVVKQRMGRRTTVLVLGYPKVLPSVIPTTCVSAPSQARADRIERATTAVNDAVRRSAQRAGFRYVDVEDLFAGHDLCRWSGAWANSIVSGYPSSSYHPNAYGHRALAQAVAAAL